MHLPLHIRAPWHGQMPGAAGEGVSEDTPWLSEEGTLKADELGWMEGKGP